ncbi:MAG: lipoprotein releasing system, transrane protein LolC/E family [Deferribacteraceae bacterium]|nr:lipoprotein releasing system, transrane protein LolC/E family [Deferribacteraceae bacterium]
MKLSNFIALRYIKSRKETRVLSFISAISIIGIVLGVATLIVVINVMIGFENNLRDKILGANSHIIVNRIDSSPISNWQEIESQIKTVEGVKGVSPFLLNQVLLTSERSVSGVIVRGIVPETEINVTNIEKYMKEGDLKSLDGEDFNIVIGKDLANSLALTVGDEIVMVSPFGKKGPLGFTPRMKRFKITGIFDTGMYEYNNTLTLIPLKAAQKFFELDDIVTGFSVSVFDVNKAGEISHAIRKKLGFPLWSRDWFSMNQNLFSALKLEKAAMFIILTLITVVASFNIMSLITMTVKDKKRDIAILRAMGASSKFIRNIFIRQGLIIGLIGIAVGNIIGYAICYVLENYKIISLPEDVYFMDRIPVKIVPEVFILVSISAIVITFISSIIPSIHASKLDPIEALRNE